MKAAMAEHEDSIGGRARDGVLGWWGRARRFLAEVRNEMSRVTWPTRKETLVPTAMVFSMVFLAAVFFFAVDTILAYGVRLLFGLGQ